MVLYSRYLHTFLIRVSGDIHSMGFIHDTFNKDLNFFLTVEGISFIIMTHLTYFSLQSVLQIIKCFLTGI